MLFGTTLGQRNPNPCAGITGVDTFVNDYASCADYFWCFNDMAVPSGPCATGQGFDIATGACTVAAGATCAECPDLVAGDPPFAVSGLSTIS